MMSINTLSASQTTLCDFFSNVAWRRTLFWLVSQQGAAVAPARGGPPDASWQSGAHPTFQLLVCDVGEGAANLAFRSVLP